MRALILAAGYATRLYPLTENTAKPLLQVGGRLILDYIVDHINSVSLIDDMIIVTNNKFYGSFCEWQAKKNNPKPITVLNDNTLSNEDRMGAIGDIRFVIEKAGLSDDILVVGGDNLFDCPLQKMVTAFQERKHAVVGVYDIPDLEQVKQYGCIRMDSAGRIIQFFEKSQNPESTCVATCLYVYPKEVMALIQTYLDEGGSPDAPGYFLEWLVKRQDVWGFVLEGQWFDIGDKNKYDEANQFYKGRGL